MFKGHVRETQAFRYQVWLEETIPMLSGVVEAGTHTHMHILHQLPGQIGYRVKP